MNQIANPQLQSAPEWRREPYRLFFPLGLLLVWAGVSHWLLHALGVLPDYRPIFHAMTQIQGFLACFAVGFLFTAVPRRTVSAPPAGWQMIVGALMPVGTTLAAWEQRWAVAQAFWVVLLLMLAGFVVPRLTSSRGGRRPPVSFVWIPVALAFGLIGSFMTGALAFGDDYQWLHDLGQRLALQGTFLALIVGLGGMVLPLLTRGESVPDAAPSHGARLALELAAAAGLAVSFWLEIFVSLRGGYLLRAVVLLVVLTFSARLWRWPGVPGWHRWLVWLSAWMIPLGYLLAAVYPAHKKAGLHVTFIAGFALLALAVGLHVTLAHGGYPKLVKGRPWQVPLFGGLLLVATVGRVLVDFDQVRFFHWIGVSSAAFLAGTFFWALLVLPRIRTRGRT